MLYPRESQTRQIKDLSGIWEFKVDRKNEGYKKKWYSKPLSKTIMMPVPCSYNDITQDSTIRDHIGDVWYQKNFFVASSWRDKRVVLRIGSAAHRATVWVNGKPRLSCTMPARQVDGRDVMTLEGLSPEIRGQISDAFVQCGGVQCGFCIPGIAMRGVALVERNAKPTREEIARDLRPHLCRCTGYVKIIDAVMLASEKKWDPRDS